MKMVCKLATLVLLMTTSVVAKAQMQVTYAFDSPTFTLAHQNTDKYDVLDSTYLDLTYQFKYRMDENDDSLSGEDLMELQIGRKYNAFFSSNLRESDETNTQTIKTTMQFTPAPPTAIGFDILFSHSTDSLQETNRIPFTRQVIDYKEKNPLIEWTYLQDDTATVMGYHCRAALCTFGGRGWKVFYAPQIALPYGPWKLNGVKGLVLKAEDTKGDFVFEAVGLTQKHKPIVRYHWKRRAMGKAEWKLYEKNIYKNAGTFARNSGARIIVMDNSEQGFHRLNEDWEQYYNPLEK